MCWGQGWSFGGVSGWEWGPCPRPPLPTNHHEAMIGRETKQQPTLPPLRHPFLPPTAAEAGDRLHCLGLSAHGAQHRGHRRAPGRAWPAAQGAGNRPARGLAAHPARAHRPPTRPSTSHAGLNLLHEMLVMFARSDFATQFYQTYYLQLLREIFAVMTGKAGGNGGGRRKMVHGRGAIGCATIPCTRWRQNQRRAINPPKHPDSMTTKKNPPQRLHSCNARRHLPQAGVQASGQDPAPPVLHPHSERGEMTHPTVGGPCRALGSGTR